MAFVGHVWRSLNFTVFSEVDEGNAFCNTLLVQHFSDQGFTSMVNGVASILWVTHTHTVKPTHLKQSCTVVDSTCRHKYSTWRIVASRSIEKTVPQSRARRILRSRFFLYMTKTSSAQPDEDGERRLGHTLFHHPRLVVCLNFLSCLTSTAQTATLLISLYT